MSDDLIDRLVADLKPLPPRPVFRRFAIGIGAGTLVAALVMWLWLGPRPDFAEAVGTDAYWMKFFYTLGLSFFALLAVGSLARPGGTARGPALAALGFIVVIALIAGVEFFHAVPAARDRLVFGATANVCPWNIVALAVPVFLGTLWALRGLAPTRLTLAGAAAGLVAGTIGAWVYAFHCDESAATFVAIWYTAGIAAVTALGALLGRYVLRW